MLKARTDDVVLMNIMNRLQPYINYITDIMYRNYGGRYDNLNSREDLHSFVSINILKAIRKYYHPEKYDDKKDKKKKKYFKDGFSYICQVSKQLLKYWWRYHRRQKRIPPEIIISLSSPINPDQENSLTVGDLILNWDKDMKNSFIADKILSYFKKHNKRIGRLTWYSLAKHIMNDNQGYKELAKFYGIPEKKMKEIIKEFVNKLKGIKL